MSYNGLKVLGLAGEYRNTSKSGMLVSEALKIAESKGAEIVFWDLNEKPLPFVGGRRLLESPNGPRISKPFARNGCVSRRFSRVSRHNVRGHEEYI